MNIRHYSFEDFQGCVELFIHVFNQEPWKDNWTQEKARQYLQDYIDTPGFKGVVADDINIKGFIMGIRKRWWSGDEFFINEMCVDTANQRSGVGTRLLDHLDNALKSEGIERITLLTSKGVPAEQFYRKNGLSTIDDLIFMYKKI
ncbi:GNAT family N-acetyltransferase [Paenibacillus oralis]|uniref:GNAT family N-acetyltransferase n=1 Tax=Paenibacillus oralis TaxID=2490856 RepID=A0A3P3TUB9_9BACL|nr:GNAT family N-acetyltransferase [Paenibacillus oralis]RRJ61731.1 GNAT family N-acetyltransferase [Paenibacillus oralis]